MNVIEGAVPGVKIEPRTLATPGILRETRRANAMKRRGFRPLRAGQSVVLCAGVLRGLHLQVAPSPQGKLVLSPGERFSIRGGRAGGFSDFRAIRYRRTHGRKWKAIVGSCGFCARICIPARRHPGGLQMHRPYDPTAELSIRWDDPELNLNTPGGPFALSVVTKPLLPSHRCWSDCPGTSHDPVF